jgi:hypothetical protein
VGVVFVQTPFDVAYSFYAERIAQGASIQEFLAVRDAPVEAQVDDLISEADAVLYNWTGKIKYKDTIRTMLDELGIGAQQS